MIDNKISRYRILGSFFFNFRHHGLDIRKLTKILRGCSTFRARQNIMLPVGITVVSGSSLQLSVCVSNVGLGWRLLANRSAECSGTWRRSPQILRVDNCCLSFLAPQLKIHFLPFHRLKKCTASQGVQCKPPAQIHMYSPTRVENISAGIAQPLV